MADQTLTSDTQSEGLHHLPVAIFAVVMGLWGWALATHAAAGHWAVLAPIAEGLRVLAVAGFALISLAYGVKAVTAFAYCREEWQNPVRMAFFPAISISVLLTATGFHADYPALAEVLWLIGVVGQGGLTLAVLSSWISHRAFQVGQLNPAWFIPAVGNVVVPVAGAPLGYLEVSWLFFSGGLVFWVVLLTLVMNRLMFHDPLPGKLVPTLVILIAPPALAFLSYVNLTAGAGGPHVDPFAHILLSLAYVFALLVLTQLPKFRNLPFALSWWALSFPVAGLAIASFRYATLAGSGFHALIGALALAALSVTVVLLLWRTTKALRKGAFFRPEA